ncbi:MAG: CHAD domain-containing protein [Gammaproteobacteria bacterium]|nr:CHAD domain-containing protein [Gammaproteobacteria bacterium]
MNCLEKYRSRLIGEINRNLRNVLAKLEEESVHNFRVGVKKLTALYYFLSEVDNNLKAKRILKPYRSLARSIGNIRDGHIAVHLLQELDEINLTESGVLIKVVRSKVRKDYRLLQQFVLSDAQIPIRVPTIRSTGISESAILRQKPVVLNRLLQQILRTGDRMNAKMWHKKRIQLKRYQHKLDAFCFCPGHKSDEDELKQIKMLQQLLGDWHDLIVTAEILQSLRGVEAEAGIAIAVMKKQDRLLLGSAKIYLNMFAIWHQNRQI